MVLSNKKLKQKMRAAKAQIIIEAAQNGGVVADPKTVVSLRNLQDPEAQRPKLSKREKRRQKAKLDNSELTDRREVHGDVDVNVKKKKRKRGETHASENGNVQEPEVSKKKPKKNKGETKNKDGHKQIKEETSKRNGVTSAEELVLSLSTGDDREEEQPSTRVYVGGIPYYSTEDDIRSYFESCGSITHVDCRKFLDSGKFRGIAIITFKTEAAAKRALALDGSDMGGLFLKIQPFNSGKANKVSHFSPIAMKGYYRIYVGNLAWNITEDELRKTFSDCKIISVRFGEDKETGDFKGYAHVDFADIISFGMALKLDQTVVRGRPIRISCAVPKKEVVPTQDSQPVGNKGVNVVQVQVNSQDTGLVPTQKDHQSDENKGRDVHQDQLNSIDKFTADTEDQENSKEANPVSSKIRRRACYECGEKGHLSTACPNKPENKNKIGVVTEDEENSNEPNPVSSKIRRRTCYECGEKGHLSTACPNKQDNEEKISEVTKDQGNIKEANPVSSQIRRRTCYECGEKGHLSTACPKKQGSEEKISEVTKDQENIKEANPVSSKIRRRTCYECGEKGHLSTSCPKKQAEEDLKSVATA